MVKKEPAGEMALEETYPDWDRSEGNVSHVLNVLECLKLLRGILTLDELRISMHGTKQTKMWQLLTPGKTKLLYNQKGKVIID